MDFDSDLLADVLGLVLDRYQSVGRNNQRALRRMFAVPVQCATLIAPYELRAQEAPAAGGRRSQTKKNFRL